MGDGTISTQVPSSGRTDTFAYDPAHPVPSMGGNVCCSSVPSGPWDQRSVERRDDILVYDGPILNQALEVTGPIKMVLYASTSAKDTDWTAKLVDVYPDGKAINIQSGIVRAIVTAPVAKRAPSRFDPERSTNMPSICGPQVRCSCRDIAYVLRFRAATSRDLTATSVRVRIPRPARAWRSRTRPFIMTPSTPRTSCYQFFRSRGSGRPQGRVVAPILTPVWVRFHLGQPGSPQSSRWV